MKEMLWSIFELIVNLFEASVLMHFVCTFLGGDIRREKERRNWLFASMIFATTTSILNSMTAYEGLMSFIYVIVIIFCALFLFKGTIQKKLLISVFAFACLTLVSSTITNLVTSITKMPITEVYTKSGWIRLVTVALVQITDLYLFQVILRIFKNRNVFFRKTEWLLLLIVFAISAALIILIQLVQLKENLAISTKALLLAADICIVIINSVVIKIFEILHSQYQTKIENELLHAELQYQTQYITAIRQQEETVRKQKHDLKNHMEVLQKYAEQENIGEICKYIRQYIGQSCTGYSFIHTNHTAIDAIINTKMNYAQEMGIHTTCVIDNNLPAIADTDYCSLIGNLLDNAIEASQKQIEDPEIKLEIAYLHPQLRIRVKNKIQESVLTKNPNLHTEKRDSAKHGYGISILKDIAEKYEGSADFYEEDSFFTAQIILYTNP